MPARPGTPNEVLDRVFEAGRTVSAVIPGIALDGTVKRVSDHADDVTADEDEAVILDSILGDAGRTVVEARTVTETIDRSGLVEVQTPQLFDADLLRRAYAQDDLSGITDDAQAVERLGEAVSVVEGDPRNLKVTRRADLELMRAILGVAPPASRPSHLSF